MAHTQDSLVQGARVGTRRRSTLTLLATLLILTVAFCGPTPVRAEQTAPTPSTLPTSSSLIHCTRIVNGQLLLPVRLTGAEGQTVDATFLLDTGVTSCCITDAMATRLGLKSEAGVGDDGKPLMLNGAVAQLAHVPRLELGSFPIDDLPCVIFGAKVVSGPAGQTVDGILGNTLLLALPALIDFSRSEVRFFVPGPITADTLRSVGMADATAIPLDDLSNNDNYACMVRVENGGKTLHKDLMIDIGSVETMINGSDARKLGLSTQGDPASELMILTGPFKVYEGKTTAVTLGIGSAAQVPMQGGNVTVQDVTVAYPKGDLPDFLPPRLGLDVLGHYLLLMDYAEKKMYLKPNVPQIKIRIGAPLDKKP